MFFGHLMLTTVSSLPSPVISQYLVPSPLTDVEPECRFWIIAAVALVIPLLAVNTVLTESRNTLII